jgi:hypothetical protein
MDTLFKTPVHKEHERLVQIDGHAARVFRLIQTASGEAIGEIVEIRYSPLVVASPIECLTADNGETFTNVDNYLDHIGVEKVVGSPEADPERLAALRLLLNEWKRQLVTIRRNADAASTD